MMLLAEVFIVPSWQSRYLRVVLRYVIRPKFVAAGISVKAHRKALDDMARFSRVPPEAQVEPVQIGDLTAEWVAGPESDSERVVLYLHGGGGVMGSADTHRELAARIALASGARVLVPNYRLAPEHPYPAALEDVTAVVRWLDRQGVRRQQLAIGGDSAGGGLSLQTLLSLRSADEPLPGAAFLLSPLVEWIHFDGESYRSRAKADPWLSEQFCRLMSAYYVADGNRDEPLLSPLRGKLDGLPPLLVQVGDDEVLLSDATRLAYAARRAGGDVTLSVWPGLWHVFQGSATALPEGREAIAHIGAFLRAKLPA